MMTGTGTQADPYKPATWAEFISYTTADNVYTELPVGGGTFDMNDYYPNGFAETIPLRGFIDGKGWTIKNAAYRGNGGSAFTTSGSSDYGQIKNLNFINFNVATTSTSTAFLIDNSSGQFFGRAFEQCQFSGRLGENSAISRCGQWSEHYRCSYNLEITGDTSIDTSYYYMSILKYCNVDVKSINGEYTIGMSPNNSYITGSLGRLWLARPNDDACKDSVIDMNLASVYQETGTPEMMLINTDKYTGTVPSGCIGVTTAQLKDAAYLHSIGFPIQV